MVFIPFEGVVGGTGSKEQLRRSASKSAQRSVQERADASSSLDALLGTSMLEPATKRHIAILSDPRFSHSVNSEPSSQIVSRLQQTYGNGHVQRVMHARQSTVAITPQSSIGSDVVNLMPDATPEAEQAIRLWLDEHFSVVLTTAALYRRLRAQVAQARDLSDTDLEAVVRRWRISQGLRPEAVASTLSTGTTPPTGASGPSEEESSGSGRLQQVRDAFSSIPTELQFNIRGNVITVDTSGASMTGAVGPVSVEAGATWGGEASVEARYAGGRGSVTTRATTAGEFRIGANFGDLQLSASVNAERYQIRMRIGPEVTAISELPQIFQNAEQGVRDLISDVSDLNLRSIDDVSESISQISDHVRPIRRAFDACSRIEEERSRSAPSLSFELTAQFPRGEGEASVQGLLTVRF